VSDERAVPVVGGNERRIWIAAILLYGIGDTVTTFWGLSTGGISEAGPIAKPLVDAYGHSALVLIKAIAFPLFYVVWRLLRTPGRIAVPFALAFVGMVVTIWNLLVIASAL